jgi:hypothetical protein
MAFDREITVTCPVPIAENQKIMLAHGGGGRLMNRLLDDVILLALHNDILAERHDCAMLPAPATARLAFTTDSYVVRPLFFPGGDIGTLAVNGTVNDLWSSATMRFGAWSVPTAAWMSWPRASSTWSWWIKICPACSAANS